jgi:protein-S-isoprenylcysteine O-methyltransferase Ste14
MVLAGQFFRLAVIGYAYIKRGGKEGKVYADRLVIRGFYAHSRNPMYLGNIFVVAGIAVIHGSWSAFALLLSFFCFAYLAIIAAEETYLKAHFPEHAVYCKTVNRIWPNFNGLAESLKDFQYDWKRALRKDYGNVFLNFSLMIFVIIWRLRIQNTILPAAAVLACFAIIALFYALSRLLKKRGLLYSPD